MVPDPELLSKLNWLCSPVLPLSTGSSGTSSCLELTYITDFFLALAICNSVVVSLPSQPQHQVQWIFLRGLPPPPMWENISNKT